MQRYKHSIATVSLSGTLHQKMKTIARAGYDGVELFDNDLLVSNLTPVELNGHSCASLPGPGLFIEVVQRISGYDRYGEVNAQVRLTAQERQILLSGGAVE